MNANDFQKCTDALSIVYADDTSCLFKHYDLNILKPTLEVNLKSIINWYCLNKLYQNVEIQSIWLLTLLKGVYQDYTWGMGRTL